MPENKKPKDKIRVGILRGGAGDNYYSSLQNGADLILHILENMSHKYKVFDILVDKNNSWHLNGLPIEPHALLYKVDIVWNLAHPSFSNILDSFSVKVVGVPPFFSLFLNSRDKFQETLKPLQVNIPRYILLPLYQKDFDGSKDEYINKKAKEVFNKFPAPWIVRSFVSDPNIPVHIAKTFTELIWALEDCLDHEKSILIEEFIVGKNVAAHSVLGFRDQDVYIFPFGKHSPEEKEKITKIIRNLHTHLGIKHYLKSDFIIHSKRGIFLSNMELDPILKKDSHFCQACESVGTKMHLVIEHIIDNALNSI